jgi:hypothetical protein
MLFVRKQPRIRLAMVWKIMACGLAAVAGCGSRGPQTYPVLLTVSFADGKIPVGAVVAFHSDTEAKTGRPYDATGTVEPDGTCRLSTFKRGDGAIAGQHRVTVGSPPYMPGMTGPQDPPRIVIASRYANQNTSKLEFTVTDDAAKNQFTVQLERPTK